MTLFVGIDPGQSGGIAWINTDTDLAGCVSMPETERDVWDVIYAATQNQYVVAIIESVFSRPGMGAPAMFKFGRGYGFLRGCLIASGASFEEATPNKWQGAMGVLSSHKNNAAAVRVHKNKLKSKAQQLFPTLKVTLKTADALLIAEYARRTYVTSAK